MSKVKKGFDMQLARGTPPLPKPVQQKLTQAEIDFPLYEAARTEGKKLEMTWREIVEWGLGSFLLQTNPKLAAQLGIRPNGDKT
jgi:hypothetical protein